MRTAKQFVPSPSMVAAAEAVFMTMALERVVKPIVLAYQKRILEEGQWHIDPSWTIGLRAVPDRVILKPEESYLLSTEDFAEYDARCKSARDAANLYIDNPEACPLLVAEHGRLRAEGALIACMAETTGVTLAKLWSPDKYREYVDLTLRLLAPYAKNRLQK